MAGIIVYRICLEIYSNELISSGRRNRWNSDGKRIIYTAGSRALACLENVVHRSGVGLNANFRTLVIELPKTAKVTEIKLSHLPANWRETQMQTTMPIGDRWFELGRTLALKVPSAIIPEECNYLLNTMHPDFRKVKIKARAPFIFDPRIKAANPE